MKKDTELKGSTLFGFVNVAVEIKQLSEAIIYEKVMFKVVVVLRMKIEKAELIINMAAGKQGYILYGQECIKDVLMKIVLLIQIMGGVALTLPQNGANFQISENGQ